MSRQPDTLSTEIPRGGKKWLHMLSTSQSYGINQKYKASTVASTKI